jgi:hypothetical protein
MPGLGVSNNRINPAAPVRQPGRAAKPPAGDLTDRVKFFIAQNPEIPRVEAETFSRNARKTGSADTLKEQTP